MASWYRRFIKGGFHLYETLDWAFEKGLWLCVADDQEATFAAIIQALTTAPVLAGPDFEVPFVLYTDASSYEI